MVLVLLFLSCHWNGFRLPRLLLIRFPSSSLIDVFGYSVSCLQSYIELATCIKFRQHRTLLFYVYSSISVNLAATLQATLVDGGGRRRRCMHGDNSIARGLSMDTVIGGQEECADTSREGYEVIYASLGIAFSMVRTRGMICTWERWRSHIYVAGTHCESLTQVQRYAQRRTKLQLQR